MNYRYVYLKDICTKIGSGSTPKGGSQIYVDKGISLIRSQNIHNLHFKYDGLAHILEKEAIQLDNVTVREHDVLLNITGDSVARTCLVPNDVLPARVNQHVAILRANQKYLDPFYLSYYLASPYMQSLMLSLAVGKGASRNAMTKEMIENFEIPLPALEDQKYIADKLTRYDMLIKNLERQVELIEELMQRHYLDWSKSLSSLSKKKACECFDITIGKTPPRGEAKWFSNANDSVKWISISDMASSNVFCLATKEKVTRNAIEKFNIKVVPQNTIIVSFKLTVGRVSITSCEMCTNEAIAHFNTSNPYLREYAYHYLRNYCWDSLGNTSAISTAINSSIVKAMDFMVPDDESLMKFSLKQKPFFDECLSLSLQISKLREARDLVMAKVFGKSEEVS